MFDSKAKVHSGIPSVINCATDKQALFNWNINAPVGDLSFDNGDFFFTHAGWRVNTHMAVLIFKGLGSGFDPRVGTKTLREQA